MYQEGRMMKRLLLGGLVRRGWRHSARLGVVPLAAVVFALVVQGKALAATTWYVSLSGADSNSCAVPASPCLTIDGAIGKAAAGDTVEVAVGTYTGAGTVVVTIGKDLTLSGGWNGTFTQRTGLSTIDGQNAHQGVYVANNATATVARFEVMNGTPTLGPADPAGGIALDGPLTLDHSYIHGNAGGVWTDGAALKIRNSTVSGNQWGVGLSSLAVAGTFTITITNSTIANNTG